MTNSSTLAAGPLTLDQFAALSDEIAALARAGVPLDRGLTNLSQELPGRLGTLAGRIGRRLAEGTALDNVVDELGRKLPPAYRTVIAAGLRAGRLPAALEGIAQAARLTSQLRRSIGLSLLYPAIVLLLAWGLGLFVLQRLAPVMLDMLREFGMVTPPVEGVLVPMIDTAPWWGIILPIALVAWFVWLWFRSAQVAWGVELHPFLSFGAVSTLARMHRASRCASLAELLALLLSHDVPLHEAVELASGAVGSPSIAKSGAELAARLQRGETIDQPPAGFPPVLAWMLAGGQPQPRLIHSLQRTAERYRDEVARRSQWLSLYVPLVLLIAICGTVVFLYAIMTLGPWIAILRRLAEIHGS